MPKRLRGPAGPSRPPGAKRPGRPDPPPRPPAPASAPAARGLAFVADITERKDAESELETYRARLERQVKKRTQELLAANVRLRNEIAERKTSEDMLRESEAKYLALAGGIAHDFRNILMAAMGSISLAKLQLRPEERIYALLDQAEKAVSRAGELTQQLMTFARGGVPVRKVVSLGALLRESVEFSLQGSTVWCELTIPDDLWPADIDAGQISQVINNLVINAVEAMPRGGKITVTAENSPTGRKREAGLADRDYVMFSIRDEGVGIPKELLAKIFDPYFTTKLKGSGLGLATCYAIVRRHEGSIQVASEPGAGSTFSVYLPASL